MAVLGNFGVARTHKSPILAGFMKYFRARNSLMWSKTNTQPETILHYANHYHTTDMFPFGPEHASGGLPPCVEKNTTITGIASWPLTLEQQKDKVYALEMMHDMKRPQKLKRRIRAQLQRLIGRQPNRYGAEGYFRKAIKSNEIFFIRNKLD